MPAFLAARHTTLCLDKDSNVMTMTESPETITSHVV